jgi:hypothetical protein
MAMGGVKKEVCKFRAISIAKKYGLTSNIASNGKNIGTKIIKISVHSNGHPNKNIIICVITKNCQGAKSIDLKKCSKTSCPPRYEKTDEKVQEPINNHIIIAVVLAVKKTDSLKFFHLRVL